jgi:hypothetical protein
MQLFILRARALVEVSSLEDWYGWFAVFGGQRIVERSVVGPSVIFTAFQGLDIPPTGPRRVDEPFTFQTLVLGGPLNGTRQSYSTWLDAERGHRELVWRVARGARAPKLVWASSHA